MVKIANGSPSKKMFLTLKKLFMVMNYHYTRKQLTDYFKRL